MSPMSHGPLAGSVNSQSTVDVYSKSYCSGTLAPYYTRYSTAIVGPIETYTLDRSKNNPKDQFGWRYPSSYYGTRVIKDSPGLYTWTYGPVSVSDECRYRDSLTAPRYTYCKGIRIVPLSLGNPPAWPNGLVDYMRDITSTNAMNDLHDRKVNMAVSIAEMQQTVDMIADAGRALADMIRCVRNRNCRGMSDRVKRMDFASAWLQYRYGWMPLLSDIYGLYETLRKYLRGDMKRLQVKGTARMKDDASAHHTNESFSYGRQTSLQPGNISHVFASCPVEFRRVYEGEYFAKYRIDARLHDDMWNWYSNTGVDDPLLILWELIPYSFVADWFANIGSFIDSLNAYNGLTPLVSCFTYGRKLTVRLDIQKLSSGYWNTKINDLTVIRPEHATYFEFTRTVGPPPAMGSLRFNQRPLNTKRLLDAMSLITQGMRR